MTPESSRIITCCWLTVTPGRHRLVADDERAGEPIGHLLHRVVVRVVHADSRGVLDRPLVGERLTRSSPGPA